MGVVQTSTRRRRYRPKATVTSTVSPIVKATTVASRIISFHSAVATTARVATRASAVAPLFVTCCAAAVGRAGARLVRAAPIAPPLSAQPEAAS